MTIKCEKLTKNKISFKKIANTSIYDIPYFVTDNKRYTKGTNGNHKIYWWNFERYLYLVEKEKT